MAGFIKQVKSYPRTFWAANTLELFERWAYYGIFNLLALYLTNSTESGALGFTQVEKGLIMGIVNAILYFLPVITGAIADKFGYRKVLIVAFIILASGYYLMGQVTGFTAVFGAGQSVLLAPCLVFFPDSRYSAWRRITKNAPSVICVLFTAREHPNRRAL